ncbi:MAG: hypothetical protein EXR72_17595 [Myxococcales bacterium]|nr:hypothetical protein [Myxococcales bacterium]
MVNVTARKIRDHGRERPAVGVGRVYSGFLVSYPVVGRGMVIFRDPNGHRMITTPVRRVLGEPDQETVYVETENSVYRLTFHKGAAPPPAPPATTPPTHPGE